MASIPLTNYMRAQIRSKIINTYRVHTNRKHDELEHLPIGKECYEYYISPEYRKLAEELNKDPKGAWVRGYHAAIIELRYVGTSGHQVHQCFKIPIDRSWLIPNHLVGRGQNYPIMELNPSMSPYKAAVDIFLEIASIHNERDYLLDKLETHVYPKCKTLNQLLTVWPTAIDYLAHDVQQRYNKSTATCSRKSTPVVELDDDVKVLLIKARLLATQT